MKTTLIAIISLILFASCARPKTFAGIAASSAKIHDKSLAVRTSANKIYTVESQTKEGFTVNIDLGDSIFFIEKFGTGVHLFFEEPKTHELAGVRKN